jgi:hypothetical protein
MNENDIEIISGDRFPITVYQLRELMGWSFGYEGELIADLWCAFNDRFWNGNLEPCPMFFPRSTTYGRWVGLFTANRARKSLHIQLKHSMSVQYKANVLLHEMIHQYLCESGQCTKHNDHPWCNEIMRITKQLWNVDIHAAPDSPRKVKGYSVRVQKPSATGQASITRKQIATWPDSIGLSVPINEFISYTLQEVVE